MRCQKALLVSVGFTVLPLLLNPPCGWAWHLGREGRIDPSAEIAFALVFVGLVLGGSLGVGLGRFGETTQRVLTIAGVMLGAGPILLGGFAGEDWMYPIGFIAGLVIGRQVAKKSVLFSSGVRRPTGLLAYGNIVVIVSAIIGAALYTAL